METVNVECQAPVTTKETAVSQLNDALPHLNRLFSDSGKLDDHVAMLSQAINDTRGQFVTMEIAEIIEVDDTTGFDRLKSALQFLASPTYEQSPPRKGFFSRLLLPRPRSPAMTTRDTLISISSVNPKRPFYSPIGFWEREDITNEDELNLACLLGIQLFRPVPWDSKEDD